MTDSFDLRYRKKWGMSQVIIIPATIFGNKFLQTLNISVASTCKFLVSMVTDPSLSNNSSKDEVLSL